LVDNFKYQSLVLCFLTGVVVFDDLPGRILKSEIELSLG